MSGKFFVIELFIFILRRLRKYNDLFVMLFDSKLSFGSLVFLLFKLFLGYKYLLIGEEKFVRIFEVEF